MKFLHIVTPIFFMTAIVSSAHADPIMPDEEQLFICKEVSPSSWGDQLEIEKIVSDLGYTPFNSKIEKGCWEVKAFDAQKEVYEFYIHPQTKEIVLRKHKPKLLE